MSKIKQAANKVSNHQRPIWRRMRSGGWGGVRDAPGLGGLGLRKLSRQPPVNQTDPLPGLSITDPVTASLARYQAAHPTAYRFVLARAPRATAFVRCNSKSYSQTFVPADSTGR